MLGRTARVKQPCKTATRLTTRVLDSVKLALVCSGSRSQKIAGTTTRIFVLYPLFVGRTDDCSRSIMDSAHAIASALSVQHLVTTDAAASELRAAAVL